MPRYFIMTVIAFWIPVTVMGLFMKNKMAPLTKKALWTTILIMLPVTFAVEYLYLRTDIWTFSQEMDPLLGIEIFGAPIEEFSFWFGGTPFILLTYLTLAWLLDKKKNPV